MPNYQKIKNMAFTFYDNFTSIPNDVFKIANEQGIEVKTEKDYEDDWGDTLEKPAILTTLGNDYFIYYKENDPYATYNILHECCHHKCKHNDDSKQHEEEADLLTCLILASPQNLIEHNFYTAESISKIYNIPISKAEFYINILLQKDDGYISAFNTYFNFIENDNTLNKKQRTVPLLTTLLYIVIIILIFILFINKKNYIDNDNKKNLEQIETTAYTLPETTTEATTSQQTTISQATTSQQPIPQSNKTVIVTKSGEKYHLPTCYHIANKSTLIEMDIKKAEDLGYKPCATCNPQ
ncbi:MAG: hypothetical protein HFE59_11540 [Clostridiales bacterium]|nr:hypothetical protein [Clostridiales bacterium]